MRETNIEWVFREMLDVQEAMERLQQAISQEFGS
jgi:hypothetical protein